MKKSRIILTVLLFFSAGFSVIKAQVITGVWKGRINNQKVEVKIIQRGSGLTGTTYYYDSPNNYLRYSIKGYFDPGTNAVVWWDDQLIEEAGYGSASENVRLLSRADFNCPGYGKMILGGQTSRVENHSDRAGELNLDKSDWSDFNDEWDFVLDNFTYGADDPGIIDSVDLIARVKKPGEEELTKSSGQEDTAFLSTLQQRLHQIRPPQPDPDNAILPIEPVKPLSIGEIFIARKKIFATEIPVSGDSIELHFYDNAQVDGDSISLFLNDKLLFEHIKLSDKAYMIKLAVTDLGPANELIMVAENLGAIPPNTSYMVAKVGGQRYEARLESTEGSSALIRLIKPKEIVSTPD